MCYLNSICFVCLNNNKLNVVFHKETDNEIYELLRYALPELTILDSEIPVYICSTCHTTLRSFCMFKKNCLENYNRLKHYTYIKVMQESNDTEDQDYRELQPRVINSEELIKYDNNIHLNIKEENEDALLSSVEHVQKPEEVIQVKEEFLAFEDSTEQEHYQQLVKNEPSDDEQDGSYANNSVDDSTLDTNRNKNEMNFTDNREFQCLKCNQVFSDKLKFNTHTNIHINNIKGLQCPICNETFKNNSNLKRHMKNHLTLKTLECSICNRYIRVGNFNKHIKTHETVKSYECSICNKKFSESHNLKMHMKIHEGIKDYECSICKKKFTQSSNMKTHMKYHLSIKNFECSYCNKKFIERGTLKRHIKIHEGIKNHECSFCKKKFTENGNLKRHMKGHLDIKNFVFSL